MLDAESEMTGGPVPGKGLHIKAVLSSVNVMMPSLFLKEARPRGISIGAMLAGSLD